MKITQQERAELREAMLKATRAADILGKPIVYEELPVVRLLDALEQAETSYETAVVQVGDTSRRSTDDVLYWKARAEQAEAERDVLAKTLADDNCPYLEFWQDFEALEIPDWCECTDTEDSGWECTKHDGAKYCWLAFAAAEAQKHGEEEA